MGESRAVAPRGRVVIQYNVPYITTMSATSADATSEWRVRTREVRSIQERTGGLVAHPAGGVA